MHPERATPGSLGRAPIAEIAAAIEAVLPELSRMPRVLMGSGALMDDPSAWVSASTHCSPRALGARRLSGARPHARRAPQGAHCEKIVTVRFNAGGVHVSPNLQRACPARAFGSCHSVCCWELVAAIEPVRSIEASHLGPSATLRPA